MHIGRRSLFGLGLLVGMLVVWSLTADARRPRAKPLRQQVAEMKARIAQLESAVSFQQRLDGSTGGGRPAPWPVPGGTGICGDPCASDGDGDGVGDCEDPCPCDPSNTDGDGDGTANCIDPCPDDATDACIDPCRSDADGDGVVDCQDPCPWDPAPAKDEDQDGLVDCQDPCPNDPANDCFFPCPLDADGDGKGDCVDPCPWGVQADGVCILPAPMGPAGMAGRIDRVYPAKR